VEGVGIRLFIVKTPMDKEGETVLYIDKATGWSLQVDFKGELFSGTLAVKETNIPGLREHVRGSG